MIIMIIIIIKWLGLLFCNRKFLETQIKKSFNKYI